jgi:hypothetical protein
MIPYTDQENEYLSSSGSYRKSNQNKHRRVKREPDLRKHDWAIRTTIEVDGREYTVPVQV